MHTYIYSKHSLFKDISRLSFIIDTVTVIVSNALFAHSLSVPHKQISVQGKLLHWHEHLSMQQSVLH